MNHPIIAWIVDDTIQALQAAAQWVEEVGAELGLDIVTFKVKNLAWSARPNGGLPNLVVLDLMQDGAPLGIDFYYELRAAEKNAQKENTRAFVIIWCGYMGEKSKPRDFAVKEGAENDRVLNLGLGYKSPGSQEELKDSVRGALGRMRSEDLWSIEAENAEL